MSEKRCHFCHDTFYETYDEHNLSCSGILIKCRSCGQGFSSDLYFEHHLEKCQMDTISCPQCDFIGNKRDMTSHRHCQYCGDTSISSLMEHERICQRNPKNLIQCKLCKGSFILDMFTDHDCTITCERCNDSVDPGKKDIHPCFQAKKIAKLTDKIKQLEKIICRGLDYQDQWSDPDSGNSVGSESDSESDSESESSS